jgi:hypothetical protein
LNNKILSTKKTISLFLAFILVTGTIALSFQSFMTAANAQVESYYDTNEYTKYTMDMANEYVDEPYC